VIVGDEVAGQEGEGAGHDFLDDGCAVAGDRDVLSTTVVVAL